MLRVFPQFYGSNNKREAKMFGRRKQKQKDFFESALELAKFKAISATADIVDIEGDKFIVFLENLRDRNIGFGFSMPVMDGDKAKINVTYFDKEISDDIYITRNSVELSPREPHRGAGYSWGNGPMPWAEDLATHIAVRAIYAYGVTKAMPKASEFDRKLTA
jgi:hypothetical protein